MKRDLATGRLIAPISTVCLLASYAVQSTLGDHDPDSCRSGYLEPFQVRLASAHNKVLLLSFLLLSLLAVADCILMID